MTRCRAVHVVPAALAALCLIAAPSWAEQGQRVKAGENRAYAFETAHPYWAGAGNRPAVVSETITSPGALFLRVHFGYMHLADGDYVTVANPDGSQFWTYTGKGPQGNGPFWSFAVDGATAIVTLHAGTQPAYGFKIDQIAHGTISLSQKTKDNATPEVVCGTDGREDVACHSGINVNPVARLLFTSGGSQYLCTGWLVAGSNSSTMLTNNHCFSSQTEVNSLQAKFNFQRTTCGGATNATTTDYAGGSFLKTNTERKRGSKGGLDYTLFTLQGNPEATWGEYMGTTKAATVGQLIYFPQHPGGRAKEIGYFEDDTHTTRCQVNTINSTYGQAATGSQTGYGCDSEGGASGSPILDASTLHAVALHHYGGVSSNPCLNSGTQMSRVCSDAGSLLSCASN